MKIERMFKGDFGKIRGFFDLQTEEGLVVKGFKIIEGINGLFVSMPSQQKDGEWQDTCYCNKETREKLNYMAIKHYEELPSKNLEQQNNQQIQTDENIPF